MGMAARISDSRLNWLVPALSCFLCLLPILLFWNRFRTLFWFHDDWQLISEMQNVGVLRWTVEPFGESFNPLFKAFWAAAVALVHGSYFGMIWVLWGTHLAILFLFAALLRRSGFAWAAVSLAVLTLGMPWSNIETLGWATQWSSLLATFFFLLAWLFVLFGESEGSSKWLALFAGASALASALSLSRGVLSGALVAFVALGESRSHGSVSRRRLPVAIFLASITVGALFGYHWMLRDFRNFQGLNGEKLTAMVSYSAHYLLLNPLFHFLPVPHKAVGLPELAIAGTCKVLIVAAGFALSQGRQRTLLWTLLLFDLGTAVLLGMGRYHLGIETAVSYRYQYVSLLCFAPFLATVAVKGLQWFTAPTARSVAFALLFVGWGAVLGYPWARHSERWAQWRGTDVRNALAATPPDQRFGLPTITAGRARELVKIYNLH